MVGDWIAGRDDIVLIERRKLAPFGLFTLVWDRLLGTYRDPLRDVPPPVVGLVSRAVPSRYLEQLTMPWDSSRIGSADAVRR